MGPSSWRHATCLIAGFLVAGLSPQLSLARTASEGSWVAFAPSRDLVTVDATIDGKGPYRFMLDTGAEGNVISPILAAKLSLTWTSENDAVGSGGVMVPSGITQALSLDIGSIDFAHPVFHVIALPRELSNPTGRETPIDGILGYDLFESLAVTIDYQRSRLYLSWPDSADDHSGVRVPFRFSEHRAPLIRAVVDGVSGLYKIDSGDNGSLTLYEDSRDKRKMRAKYRRHITMVTGMAIGGPIRADVMRVKRFTIATLSISEPVAEIMYRGPQLLSNDPWSGAIGNEILKHFTVAFDYAKREIWFKPNDTIRDPEPFNRSGLIVSVANDRNDLEIVYVIKGSPAYLDGVESGDVILSMDGVPSAHLNYDLIREKTRQPVGTRLRLMLLRHGIVHRISFTLQDLI